MIIIGSIFCTLALLILPFAWRGRVIARGQFCRKCKFDLAGLDIEHHESKCPECGGGVESDSSRRVLLRKSSAAGLVLGMVLLVSGAGSLGIGTTGKTSVLLGVLPDNAVFWLHDLGVDEALDEIVARVSLVPITLAENLQAKAIKGGLAHQADTTQIWDPRWGEVLAVMSGYPSMSQEQIAQYIGNGINIQAQIRDRVYQGAGSVDFTLTTSQGRITSLNFMDTGFFISQKPTQTGIVGEDPEVYPKNAGIATNLTVSNSGGMVMPWKGKITPATGGFDVEPGTSVQVFVEYELRYWPRGGKGFSAGKHRLEQSVLVLAHEDQIVPLFKDQELAQQICQAISISTVRVLKEIPDVDPMRGHSVLAIRTQFEPLPATTAFDVFFRFDGGEEFQFGSLINHDPDQRRRGGILTWPRGIFIEEVRAPTGPLVARLVAQGKVDVIMRPNASLADTIPRIERVLDVSLEFLDVPVEIVDKGFGLQKTANKPELLHAGQCP